MRKFQIKEDNGQVLIDVLVFSPKDKGKYKRYNFNELTASLSGNNVVISKGSVVIIRSVLYTGFEDASGDQMGVNAQATVDELNAIFKGKAVRDYKMTDYSTNTSFSGDVSYIEFPESPYGNILDNLKKEVVLFGDSEDTVRGDSNTLELRNLSSGATVSYEITVKCNVDSNATFTLSSLSGQFSSSSYTFISLNTDTTHVFSGSSSVTNSSDWKLFGSIDCDGAGTYRISDVKITVTR